MARYTLDRYDPNKDPIRVDDSSIITQAGLKWVGQYYSRFGEIILENMLHSVENFSGPNPPGFTDNENLRFNDLLGQLWYSTDNNFESSQLLKIKNNNINKGTDGWKRLELIITNDSPKVHTQGEIWYDPSDRTFSISRNNRWEDLSVKSAHSAETLDGISADSFLRKDIDDVMNGTLTARNIKPSKHQTYDLGDEGMEWKTIFVRTLETTFSGTLNPKIDSKHYLGNNRNRWGGIYVDFVNSLSYLDVIPNLDATYSLGNINYRWKEFWTREIYIEGINNAIPIDNEGTVGTQSKRWPEGYFKELDTLRIKNLIPPSNNTYVIGNSTNKWKEIYANLLHDIETKSLKPVSSDSFDLGTNDRKYNRIFVNNIPNNITLGGNINFDIIQNNNSDGITWSGLTDLHQIYVSADNNGRTNLVILNSDDNTDGTVFAHNATGTNYNQEILRITRNETESSVPIRAKQGIKVENNNKGVNVVYNYSNECLEFKFY